MSKIVSSPIFMPRLMNQDGAATEIGKLPASLMNANIVAHYKNLATKARNASELFVIDPMTNNMVYDAFTEKKAFQKVPYAPKKPFEIAKLFGDEKYRIASLVEPSIKFQLDKGADLVIAPYFFSEDASGDKFRLNHTLIPDSIKFMKREKIEKSLFAMINIGNSGLGNPKILNHIIDRYNDCSADLRGYFIMIDNLNDIKSDEDSLKGLAWLVFQLSASKDIFVLSIGAFGEVLNAIGASGFSGGLGWLETFSEKNLKQKLKFSPRKKKAAQTYIPELFDYVNDEIVRLINYKCPCVSCGGKMPVDYTSKKLHFLHRRLNSMKKMAGLSRNERMGLMRGRLEEALDLAEGLYERFAIPLQTSHLKRWMGVLESSKRWKYGADQDKADADLAQVIHEARTK